MRERVINGRERGWNKDGDAHCCAQRESRMKERVTNERESHECEIEGLE